VRRRAAEVLPGAAPGIEGSVTAIITGADSGIGRATAVALARRGHDVGITYNRDVHGAERTAMEATSHGRRAEVRHLDLTRSHTIAPTVESLADMLGGLDVLVNNAGRGAATPFLEAELDEWRDVFEVNASGPSFRGWCSRSARSWCSTS